MKLINKERNSKTEERIKEIGDKTLEKPRKRNKKKKKKRKGVKKSYGTYEISSTEPIYAYESLRRQEKEKGRKLI